MLPGQVRLTLPDWVQGVVDTDRAYAADEDKVALAIELSRRNIEAMTGGPFGAAVFAPDHRIVAAGVNVVLPQHASVAHAETMAYLLAQQALGRARLNEHDDGRRDGPYVLATSAQPCCQCYGATVWAGIDRLLIGARSDDVEALTEFDEGPLPADWVGELGRRGIEVVRDLHRDAARAVLAEYGAKGGRRY
jgi:tRNA(Arg) A34 adenosine deaminase TadA